MMQESIVTHLSDRFGKSKKQRRDEFRQLITELGTNDFDQRQRAEQRLQQMPVEEQATWLREFCAQDDVRRTEMLLTFLFIVTPVLLLFVLWDAAAQGRWGFILWLLGAIAWRLIMTPARRRTARQPAMEGAIQLLLRLDAPELTPSLIQMLPYLQSQRQNEDESLYQETLETLARRLPAYPSADLPPLTGREHKALRSQVEHLTARLSDPSPALTDAEAHFLIAALNVLHPPSENRNNNVLATTKAVQSLAGAETRTDLSENWRRVSEAVQEQVIVRKSRS
jgi:hypothetical protein